MFCLILYASANSCCNSFTRFSMYNLSFILLNLSFRDFFLANCNFDTGTICSYRNGTGQFYWKVQRGSTPSRGTGPSSGVGGRGKLLILIEID